jgi:hypothetical protein
VFSHGDWHALQQYGMRPVQRGYVGLEFAVHNEQVRVLTGASRPLVASTPRAVAAREVAVARASARESPAVTNSPTAWPRVARDPAGVQVKPVDASMGLLRRRVA